MKKNNQQRLAFTLVEVLLGLLLFSVLALVLYSTLFSGFKIQQRSDEQGAMYHQAKMTLDQMTYELEQAIHFDFSNISSDLRSLEGAAQKIVFLVIDKKGAIKRVSYYLEEKDKVHIYKVLVGRSFKDNVSTTNIQSKEVRPLVLMRKEESLVDIFNENPSPQVQEEVLLDNVQPDSFSFFYAYLQTVKGEPSLAWQEVWDKDYLPSGIRIKVTVFPAGKDPKPLSLQKDIYNPAGSWGETS